MKNREIMKSHQSAFTLIELTIVVAMLTIMSGFMATMWSGMEKMSKSVGRNMDFTFQSRKILDRMREDIRHSIQVSRSDQVVLRLTQMQISGKPRQVVYRMDGKELVRDILQEDALIQSAKIVTLGDRLIDIAFLSNGMIRLEVRRKPSERPLEMRNHRLSTYVCRIGGFS